MIPPMNMKMERGLKGQDMTLKILPSPPVRHFFPIRFQVTDGLANLVMAYMPANFRLCPLYSATVWGPNPQHASLLGSLPIQIMIGFIIVGLSAN